MGSLSKASGRQYLGVDKNDDSDIVLLKMADVVNNILQGKLNNNGVVTLAANSATTTLTDARIGPNSTISLMPTTANAVAENVYFSTFANGSCVLNHTNNAQTDRAYSYTVIG